MLVLLGPVAAGKGTQAASAARNHGLLHLSTGDLFRRAMREGTPLGEVAQGYMRRGELVPDEITVRMVGEALTESVASAGVVFDGFPRTLEQAQALDHLLAERGSAIDRAILIDVPEDVLVARVAGRWVCPQCGTPYHATNDPPREAGICDRDGTSLVQREDDRPEVFRARLREQLPPMYDVAAYYEKHGLLSRVDGRQAIDAVANAIGEVIEGVATSAGRG
ncbi:MAG TPA: adenylate kinase [Candidatus Limnocylindria bacterium]|nr:adenylate kinase [Candidatus Limnocylindria bacterium]